MLTEKSLNERCLMLCCSWLGVPEEETIVGSTEQHDQSALVARLQSWLDDLLSRLSFNQRRPRNAHVGMHASILEAVACAISDEWLSSHEWVDERDSPTRLHALFLCAFIAKVGIGNQSEFSTVISMSSNKTLSDPEPVIDR